MDLDTLERYYDIKQNEIELVSNRGFVVPDFEKEAFENIDDFENYITNPDYNNVESSEFWNRRGLDGISIVSIKQINTKINKTHPQQLMWQVYWNENRSKLLLIYYFHSPAEKQIPTDFAGLFHEMIDLIIRATNISDISIVLVANTEPSPKAKEQLKIIPKVRLFLDDEFTFNPVNHVYNQQYILLSKEEVALLMFELKISKEKLPSIKYDLPVARYYGLLPGDVVRIIRTERYVSVLAKKGCNYRVVIV